MTSEFMRTQSYLGSFRVAELKELLKSLNCPTNGRKKDLLLRVEQLIRSGTPKVHRQIEEIYRKHFGDRHSSSRAHYSRSPPKPPISRTTALPPPTFHVKYPDVKMKPHPFYQNIETIVRPTFLVSQTPSNYRRENVMMLQFHLSPQQIQQIFMSETTPGNYQTQVVLRLCRRETSCEQEDYCPTHCHLEVNKNICTIPGYNIHLSTKPDYKYQMKPINITTYVHTSAALANTVTVSWQDDVMFPQGFCIAIELLRALSPSDLLQTLKGRGIKSPEVSRALVKEKLANEKDSEISATSLRISLICPLGKMKMSYPCRSISCNHLQCFDASTYLQWNEKKARWVCPVCDKPAPFADLIIDGLMMEICSQCKDTDIEFSADGSWRSIKSESKITYSLMNSTSPVTISDSPSTSGASHPSTVKAIVIDLTLDSEEEEDPINKESLRTPESEPKSPSILVPNLHLLTTTPPDSSLASSSYAVSSTVDTPLTAVTLDRSATPDAGTTAAVTATSTRLPVISTTRTSILPRSSHKRTASSREDYHHPVQTGYSASTSSSCYTLMPPPSRAIIYQLSHQPFYHRHDDHRSRYQEIEANYLSQRFRSYSPVSSNSGTSNSDEDY